MPIPEKKPTTPDNESDENKSESKSPLGNNTFGLIGALIIGLLAMVLGGGAMGGMLGGLIGLVLGNTQDKDGGVTGSVVQAITGAAPPSKTTDPSNNPTTSLKQEEVISGTLTALSNTKEAANLSSIGHVGFSDGKGYGKSITEDSMKQVSIEVDGQTRYFKQIDRIDGEHGTTTGLKATAYVETDKDGKTLLDKDGKCDIRLCFSGYSGNLNDNSAQTASLKAVIDGKLNPQAAEAAAFADRVINSKEIGGRNHIDGIIFGAHSLGSSNALAASAVCNMEGVKCETTLLLEPAAATLEAKKLQEAMQDKTSDFSKTMQTLAKQSGVAKTDDEAAAKVAGETASLQKNIDNNTISIRTVTQTPKGWEGTRVAYLVPELTPGGDNLAAGQMHEIGRSIGTIQQNIFDERDNPKNFMLGKAVYQNVTGNSNIVQNGSVMAQMDPNHQLANVINGAKGDDQFMTTNDAGKTLAAANVKLDGNTQGPAGRANTGGTQLAANQENTR